MIKHVENPGIAASEVEKQDIFPRDENGIPLHIFLVTVKNKQEADSKEKDVERFVVFAVTSHEAHEKITNWLDRGQAGRAAWRITTEYAQIVSGGGIVKL